MASIVKRKKKYSVVYTYTDENDNKRHFKTKTHRGRVFYITVEGSAPVFAFSYSCCTKASLYV